MLQAAKASLQLVLHCTLGMRLTAQQPLDAIIIGL
jgi:hypothetical protein